MSTEKHNATLESKRAEKRKQQAEDSPAEKRELVIEGAKLKCPYAQGLGKLVVTSNKLLLQDQTWATKGDGNNMVNLQFDGVCNHPKWPNRKMSPPPCKQVIKLSPWENLGSFFIQEQQNLVKESTIKCDPEFNSAVASPIPNAESIVSNLIDKPSIIDAYFAKITTEPPVKKGEKPKLVIAPITTRGLSYQAAIVIDTALLNGKKIKVKIKSGKRKVLTDVDSAVAFINMEDINKVDASKPDNYATVASKDIFEITVDNVANRKDIANAGDFKNKAVLQLMLNQKAGDLSLDLAKLINADADKSAYLYIEVTCDEPNIQYNGKKGTGENANTFLNDEGKYFSLTYLEPSWIYTARLEQEAGISEADKTGQSKIRDTYHQINRQHKPKGYLGIDNAWCASFVGWCLQQNNMSAQLDPGAYSYGYINTRYRKDFKVDGKKVDKEYFGDPVWAQKINKLVLGGICVVNNSKHVTFSIAQNASKTHIFGLGGNQGDMVRVSAYSTINAKVLPIEYKIKNEDYELPIYYRSLKAESVT